MSDEQANELIRLRHRLRAMALMGKHDIIVSQTLEQFRDLSETVGDAGLCMEATRWRVQFEQLAHRQPLH